MNQSNNTAQYNILSTINKVEGFDPIPLAVEYLDLTTQEKRKRLPVMAQLAWFRLKFPEGKIALHVEAVKDYFVATARIYVSYKDPVECYLSEATASRKYDPLKPTVSPREWAQTAAIGIALRNAGFGLQFGAAGDDFGSEVPDELGVGAGITPPPAANPASAGNNEQTDSESPVTLPTPQPEPKLADSYSRDETVRAAAEYICSYSMAQATA